MKPNLLLLLLLALLALVGCSTPAVAHDLPAERLVELTVLTWANARSGGDTARLAEVFSDRFKGEWR